MTRETRKDKYGQNHKSICKCGISSNWHTTPERADIGLRQEHEYLRVTLC